MRIFPREHLRNKLYMNFKSILDNSNFNLKILQFFFYAHSDQSLRTPVDKISGRKLSVATIY